MGSHPSNSEGWTDFGGQSRKFHYIPADDSRALCGKWGLSPYIADAREKASLQPDGGKPSPDDCKACRRKLDADQSNGHREHRTTVQAARRRTAKGGRTTFYATCSCGELRGPARASADRAERDARTHREGR